MKHPGMYYLCYAAGGLFVAVMLVAVYHLAMVWATASNM